MQQPADSFERERGRSGSFSGSSLDDSSSDLSQSPPHNPFALSSEASHSGPYQDHGSYPQPSQPPFPPEHTQYYPPPHHAGPGYHPMPASYVYGASSSSNEIPGYPPSQSQPSPNGGSSDGRTGQQPPYPQGISNGPPRLPPILQVEKQLVTTTATQAASASRRRNDALFKCPVPGCGSTFTRRFNLRGHLRSHTEERPFVCDWPGCGKGFARQHDCKRHQALHTAKTGQHSCDGCGKTFSRTDALNRHLRSEGGSACAQKIAASGGGSNGSRRGVPAAVHAVSAGKSPNPSVGDAENNSRKEGMAS